jgi:hypothetical protein
MKSVPEDTAKLGPEGTRWYGGPVDRTAASLRVRCAPEDHHVVSELLGVPLTSGSGSCSLSAPDSLSGDLEAQLGWLFSQTTSDLARWREVTTRWPTDVFCRLFLERNNRGLTLSSEITRKLGDRGIAIGLDIYGVDDAVS